MNAMPTAAAAGKIDVGGDLRVNRLGLGAMRITGSGIWGDPPDRSERSPVAKDCDLDHRYRLLARTDIERIKDALDSERWPPGTIAIFSCSGRGLYEEIPAVGADRGGPGA
jgi:hypothetical protein